MEALSPSSDSSTAPSGQKTPMREKPAEAKREKFFDDSRGNETKDKIIDEQNLPCTTEDNAKRREPIRITIDDLGPTLPVLRWRRKSQFIFVYAIKHRKLPIIIMGAFITFIVFGVLFWNELHIPSTSLRTPQGIIEWLLNAQTILGMGTLLVALFVWIGGIEEDWENDLPKRLSVFFFWGAKPVIVSRYAWLAGEDEIRTWGQQVGVQAQDVQPGEKPHDSFLHFGPDMQTRHPELLEGLDGEVWKNYSICFKLTCLNKSLERTKDYCRYQNIAGIDTAAQNFPMELVESIEEVSSWKKVMIRKKYSSDPTKIQSQSVISPLR
jgi:hypothetical protein